MQKYLKINSVYNTGLTSYISSWVSKGLSDENAKPLAIPNNRLVPELRYADTKATVELGGTFLKQDEITYTHGTIVNIYIIYELTPDFNNFDFALENLSI